HRENKHALAAEAIAEVAEDDAADGAGEVSGGERREAGKRAHQGREVGEEDVLEHEGGADGIDEEVVVLDDAAQIRRGGGSIEHRRGFGGSQVILADVWLGWGDRSFAGPGVGWRGALEYYALASRDATRMRY